MTSERRIIVSLADIKLISYECKKCGARVSFSPDAVLGATELCFQCKHPWQSAYDDVPMPTPAYSVQSPTRKLSRAIASMRNPDVAGPLGFRILFEFEEPSMPLVSQTSTPRQ